MAPALQVDSLPLSHKESPMVNHYLSLTEGNGTLLQYSWLENPVDGVASWAAVHGVARSRTRLKRLSSSSSTSSSSNCVPGHYAKWHDFFHLIFTRPLWSRYSSYYTDEESSQLDFTQGSQYNVRVYDLNHCASCLLLRSVVCLPIFHFY